MVTVGLVATTCPEILTVLSDTEKLSGPSVVESDVGVIENCAAFELIETDPLVLLLKSALLLVLLLMVQYSTVPLPTREVVT